MFDLKADCEQLTEIAKHRNYKRIVITQEEVIKSLRRVKVGKTCGPDNINVIVSRSFIEQLADPFFNTFQYSLDHSIVPTIWKMSEIIPAPKIRFKKKTE